MQGEFGHEQVVEAVRGKGALLDFGGRRLNRRLGCGGFGYGLGRAGLQRATGDQNAADSSNPRALFIVIY